MPRIINITRAFNSMDDNPRYTVVFSDGRIAQTAPDGEVNDVIINDEYQDVDLDVTFEQGMITKVVAK